MYFHKIRHPSNFRFAQSHARETLTLDSGQLQTRVRNLGADVFHVALGDPARWPIDARVLPLHEQAFTNEQSRYDLTWTPAAGLLLQDVASAETVLVGTDGASLGVCGSAWLVQLRRHAAMRFFGQGEKVTGLEKSGKRTKFWNADVWADHAMHTVEHGQADPQYASVPYLLVQQGRHWVGILVDHPGAVFMDTGSNWCILGHDDQAAEPSFWFGADQGVPAFYVIVAPTPAVVTERLQRLVGTTPLPPLWALGHHQSRWGYASAQHLQDLDAAFTHHGFPNDGLWLDIDYMDQFKVFTTNAQHFGNLRQDLLALQAQGRRVVPILDPGVKVDANYAVAQSGQEADIFCLTPEGVPYVGFVWPGRSWFPDFSLPEARAWWADHARAFREQGFDGAWLDMNDPSTGAAELDDMRFRRGAWPHWTYHNQYATGMAEATRAGFLAARPDERPFLLSRSAYTGSSRFCAVWTGDNLSTWQHLRASIACSLNLALSGLPFNGPDVPGFGGHADADLAVAWYKAAFLFPFLRNHASAGTARQEPWAFGDQALAIIRHHVQLRYKLLPTLVQLWHAQEQRGCALLRPLFYEFAAQDGVADLSAVDDQFMIGPAIMQAPLLHAGQQRRRVVLPAEARWLDVQQGRFVAGGRIVDVVSSVQATPLYLREGYVLPMQPAERGTAHSDLADIELHVLLGQGSSLTARLEYVAEDGISFGYQRGARSVARFSVQRQGDSLCLDWSVVQAGWKPLRVRVVGYDGARLLRWTFQGRAMPEQTLQPMDWAISGGVLTLAISAPLGELPDGDCQSTVA